MKIESEIKQIFKSQAATITPDPQLKMTIDNAIDHAVPTRSVLHKMHFHTIIIQKRFAAIAAATLILILLSGGTAYAIYTQKHYTMSAISSNVSTLNEAQQQAGFEFSLDPHVNNGYHMQHYYVITGTDSAFEEDTPLLTDVKSVSITIQYHNSTDPGSVNLNAKLSNDIDSIMLQDFEEHVSQAADLGIDHAEKGIYEDTIYYVTSYDGVMSIIWQNDNLTYTLWNNQNSSITNDALLNMAKELMTQS